MLLLRLAVSATKSRGPADNYGKRVLSMHLDPAHDFIRTPRTRCLNEACKKIENTSLEGWERSHAFVEHLCTFAHAHFHLVAQDHRKWLSYRLLVHPGSH